MGGVAFVWFALRNRLPRPLLRRFILLLVFASMFAHHQLGYNGEVFTAILVLIGTVALLGNRAWPGWLAVAVGVASTAAALPAMALMTAKRAWYVRRLRWVLAVCAAVHHSGGRGICCSRRFPRLSRWPYAATSRTPRRCPTS
ncbi:hypothetical protein J5X84_20105 [Streptosporangiaceae bacterium NEAU-GS5]|nr:hypothetical protein [Streptosporangiaceae bacterium NEAU-GS5]